MKCLDEAFGRDDFRLVNDIKHTFDCGYIPICFCAPDQVRSWCSCGGYLDRSLTLKFYYATQIWSETIAQLNDEYINARDGLFGKVFWEESQDSYNAIKFERQFDNPTYAEMSKLFGDKLKSVADSAKIKVSEGAQLWSENVQPFFTNETSKTLVKIRKQFVVDKENLNERRGYHLDFSEYDFSVFLKTYKWSEIKDFFVELTPKQLSLLHCEHLTPKYIEGSVEEKLFRACGDLDIAKVHEALNEGVNLNALNGAESAVHACVEAASVGYDNPNDLDGYNKYVQETRPMTIKAKEIISLLLSKGADIDLFGVDGCSPLYECYYCNNLELMEFLLKNGANPNHNSWLCDSCDWYVCSSVLDSVQERISYQATCEGAVLPDYEKMEKLLIKHGAKMYIDGFNPDEYFGTR